jgi:uncharacterized protein (DUF362 family)
MEATEDWGGTRMSRSPDLRSVFLARTEPTYASSVDEALGRLLESSGLAPEPVGSASWNPLGAFVEAGDRVLVKPNWVSHQNRSGAGSECLVTHTSVLRAVLRLLQKARPSAVIVGDAPLQGCDFKALSREGGLERLRDEFGEAFPTLDIRDFRLVTRRAGGLAARPTGTTRSPEDYVLFDLGATSQLEPICSERTHFRVTMYDPDIIEATHRRGVHQYLVAREIIDADVVINVPKVKTHKKSGFTGALKNLVGINGHKSYLPHHRKGAPPQGGDCYPQPDCRKRLTEELLDFVNRNAESRLAPLYAAAARAAIRGQRALDGAFDLEGSWYGNDTVWRMTLDLQRIARFGRPDGSIAAEPQRRMLHVADGIIAGQGEGPLAPDPLPLGIISLGLSAAAVDLVNALLLGLDPARIPLIRRAFDLEGFPPGEVVVFVDGERLTPEDAARRYGTHARPPSGWQGHCEWRSGSE